MQNSSKEIKEHAGYIYDKIYSEIENMSYDISDAIDDAEIMNIAIKLAEDEYSYEMETRAESMREE
jgi:hypothetical protein